MSDVVAKAGIVTYAHCQNYGAELQACALCDVIRRVTRGSIEAEIIWFDRPPQTYHERLGIIVGGMWRRFRRSPLKGSLEIVRLVVRIVAGKICKSDKKLRCRLSKRAAAFEDFWEKFERHSHKVSVSEIGQMPYDILIAGSDQIWNWRLTGDLSPFFLRFNPPSKARRRISYAASVSVASIDERHEDAYRKGLATLDQISVRELQGRRLLARLTNKSIEVVLDPTLLLSADDWMAYERDDLHVQGEYVLVYNLNSSVRFWKRVERFARQRGLRVVNVYGTSCAPKFVDAMEVLTAGPSDFLHLIRHAKMVITNSFHGTAFSVNFKIPFVSVLNPASALNMRIESLAKLLRLEDRVICDDEDVELLSLPDIDYHSVHLKLEELRQSSMDFLRRGIGG